MNSKLINGGKLLAGILGLALLASCIDVTEEFWIDPDGGGRMKFEMGMSAQMVAMAKLGGEAGGNPFEGAGDELSQDPNVENFEVKEETRDDMTFYVMDVTVKDLSQVTDTVNQTMSESDSPGGTSIRLARLENGNYHFTQPLDFESDAEEAANPITAGLMATMFQGRHMTIRIHGNIVSANGTIAEDGQSVEWKFPLVDLVAGRVSLEQAEAEISLRSGPNIDWKLVMILLAIVGVALIAVIAFTLGKKKGSVGT